jgi:hypothetical protein
MSCRGHNVTVGHGDFRTVHCPACPEHNCQREGLCVGEHVKQPHPSGFRFCRKCSEQVIGPKYEISNDAFNRMLDGIEQLRWTCQCGFTWTERVHG